MEGQLRYLVFVIFRLIGFKSQINSKLMAPKKKKKTAPTRSCRTLNGYRDN